MFAHTSVYIVAVTRNDIFNCRCSDAIAKGYATVGSRDLGSLYHRETRSSEPGVFRINMPCQNRLYSSAFVGTRLPTASKDSRVSRQIERISGYADLESSNRRCRELSWLPSHYPVKHRN